MRREHDEAGAFHQIVHPLARALDERHVARGHHFVEEQNLRIDGGRRRECQADVHAGRIVAHRNVQELAEIRELGDAVDLAIDLLRHHAEQQGAGPDVFPAGRFHLEPGDELEERAHMAVDGHAAALRRVDAGHDLEQRALPGAVVSDESDAFPRGDRHRHRLQRLHRPRDRSAAQAETVGEHRIQRVLPLGADVEFEIDVVEKNAGHSVYSAKTMRRLKTAMTAAAPMPSTTRINPAAT